MKKIFYFFALTLFIMSCKQPAVNPGIVVGADAPDIELMDAAGVSHKLSDLKGKAVILSFWASWCPYCRTDSPNLVALYNKYNSKGLEVYSVSLDTKKADWEKAVKDDGLVWKNHVSDLKKWSSSAVQTYNVSATPFKVLINKSGKIQVLDFLTSQSAEVEKALK
jgi:peroxiredoxin